MVNETFFNGSCLMSKSAYHSEKCSSLRLRLIEDEKLDVNLRHPLGWTPLLVAVINNKIECVRYLLSKGADPNQADEFSNLKAMAKKLQWTTVQGKNAHATTIPPS